MATTTQAYNDGFDHGVDAGVLICFGGSKKSWPLFNTQAEYDDYQAGYDDGLYSIDVLDD